MGAFFLSSIFRARSCTPEGTFLFLARSFTSDSRSWARNFIDTGSGTFYPGTADRVAPLDGDMRKGPGFDAGDTGSTSPTIGYDSPRRQGSGLGQKRIHRMGYRGADALHVPHREALRLKALGQDGIGRQRTGIASEVSHGYLLKG